MIAFAIGKKGSGKSYYVKGFLAHTRKPFIVTDPLMEYPVEQRFTSIESFTEALQEGELKKSVGLTLPTTDEVFELFAWSWNMKPHILVIEEFHIYANAWSVSKPLQRLFRMGRHRQIDIIGITQRFVDLPQIAITQADALIIFRQQGIRDIGAIEKVTDPETAMRVANLRDHERVEYQF